MCRKLVAASHTDQARAADVRGLEAEHLARAQRADGNLLEHGQRAARVVGVPVRHHHHPQRRGVDARPVVASG